MIHHTDAMNFSRSYNEDELQGGDFVDMHTLTSPADFGGGVKEEKKKKKK